MRLVVLEKVDGHHAVDANDDDEEEKSVANEPDRVGECAESSTHVLERMENANDAEDSEKTDNTQSSTSASGHDVHGVSKRHQDNDQVEPTPAAPHKRPEPVAIDIHDELDEINEDDNHFHIVEVGMRRVLRVAALIE